MYSTLYACLTDKRKRERQTVLCSVTSFAPLPGFSCIDWLYNN